MLCVYTCMCIYIWEILVHVIVNTVCVSFQDLNRVLHNMQTRVAGLIERCQDEVVLEGTLVINDDLNTLFVRYERWLRNSAAAKGTALPSGDQGTVVAPNGEAMTSLTEVGGFSFSLVPSLSLLLPLPINRAMILLLLSLSCIDRLSYDSSLLCIAIFVFL